jgi:hypothetical protein
MGEEARRAKNEKTTNEHHSLGRCNMLTGEITMPPYDKRNKIQKEESNLGKRVERLTKNGKVVIAHEKSLQSIRTTDVLAQASEIRFIPRIMSCTFTGIMQSGLVAAQREWHWRVDMPWENFIDTVIYNYFYEHGIQLAGYIVDDSMAKSDGDGHLDDDETVADDKSVVQDSNEEDKVAANV